MSLKVPSAVVPLVATNITFTTIAFTLVMARIYTRAIMLKISGMDDWLILAAMAVSIAFCITVFYQIRYGLGKPIMKIPFYELEKFFQCFWATIPLYNLSLALTKISIVLQYRRLFKTLRQLCNTMVAVFIVYGCWTVLGSIFMCIPVAYQWDHTINGHCMNRTAFFFSNAALNIATDVLLVASPIPSLVRLRLPKKQKIGLILVFGCGIFVCVTSVIRLKSLHEISFSTDGSLAGVNVAIWSGVEINVAISCACLPTLKPLFSKILPRLLFNLSCQKRSDVHSSSGRQTESQEINTLRNKSKTTLRDDEIPAEQISGRAEQIPIEENSSQRRREQEESGELECNLLFEEQRGKQGGEGY